MNNEKRGVATTNSIKYGASPGPIERNGQIGPFDDLV